MMLEEMAGNNSTNSDKNIIGVHALRHFRDVWFSAASNIPNGGNDDVDNISGNGREISKADSNADTCLAPYPRLSDRRRTSQPTPATRQALKQVQDHRGKEEAYSTVKGMLKGLGDPFTRFLTPQVLTVPPRFVLFALAFSECPC